MATAEELLSELTATDKTLVISNDLRTITIPPTVYNLGVESDDEVLRLDFKMPRYIGDIDLSTFGARINYLNSKGESDAYTVDDRVIADDYITFSWLVGPTATRYKGDTKFNVCLVKLTSNGDYVDKEYNTTVATLKVLEGLEVDESIVEEYSDILEQWRKKLLDAKDSPAYYISLSDALAEINAVDNGVILAYTAPDGVFNIMLLDDIESREKITVERDCVIHLNGKTLSFTAPGAEFFITNANVTINGEITGSVIRKDDIETSYDSTQECIINMPDENSSLIIVGGLYTANNFKSSVGYASNDTNKEKPMYARLTMFRCFGRTSMRECTAEALNGTGDIYGVACTADLNIEQCSFNIITCGTIYGVYNTGSALKSKLAESEFNTTCLGSNLRTHSVQAISEAIAADDITFDLTLDNCKINAKATEKGSRAYGVFTYVYASDDLVLENPPILTINNCHIEADGFADYDSEDSEGNVTTNVTGVYAIDSGNHINVYINGGYYWGAREALSLSWVARINGGVFGGGQHGSAYMSGHDIQCKNATLCGTGRKNFANEHFNNENGIGGCAYCGSSKNKDVNVYFDNCRFMPVGLHVPFGIVAKYDGTKVHLSNCEFVETVGTMDAHLRADTGNKIYVGKNVKYETVHHSGALIDTTTYANQEFCQEIDGYVNDELGNWIELANFGVNATKLAAKLAALEESINTIRETLNGIITT